MQTQEPVNITQSPFALYQAQFPRDEVTPEAGARQWRQWYGVLRARHIFYGLHAGVFFALPPVWVGTGVWWLGALAALGVTGVFWLHAEHCIRKRQAVRATLGL